MQKYHTVGTIPISNIKIVERGKIDTSNTQTLDRSLSWLVTGWLDFSQGHALHFYLDIYSIINRHSAIYQHFIDEHFLLVPVSSHAQIAIDNHSYQLLTNTYECTSKLITLLIYDICKL